MLNDAPEVKMNRAPSSFMSSTFCLLNLITWSSMDAELFVADPCDADDGHRTTFSLVTEAFADAGAFGHSFKCFFILGMWRISVYSSQCLHLTLATPSMITGIKWEEVCRSRGLPIAGKGNKIWLRQVSLLSES